MRNGSCVRFRRQRGIAYVGVMVLVAITALGLMEAGSIWKTTRQRERETELLAVGSEIRHAIGEYYQAGPGEMYPKSLEALVEDKRAPTARHHLRRLYADPLSGKTDWGILKTPDGAIRGVYSVAEGRPLKQGGFREADESFANASSYEDWKFVYQPQVQR